MNIAKYYASIGFQVDTRDIQKVDRALKLVENKLKGLQKRLATSLTFDISKFDVNQRRLNRVLGDALDVASTRTVFQVSRFNIDQGSLNRSLTRAMTEASRVASVAAPIRPNMQSSVARAAATGAAFGGIGLGRLGYAGLALAGGGYGLGALNRRNQEVVSAQLQSQAVVQQAGGTVQQGQESFQWLRNQANRIGFNYLNASPDYNKLLSGLTGAGMSIQQGQSVYKGFAELSRVNKLDRTQQQRVFRALSQIAGKNKLQSEELQGQLAESLPGAVSLFARAYQAQIGGSKTGQEAITQLLDAMKKGQVKGNILTYAGTLASQQAAPSLAAAGTASQAEQARYQNAVSDLAVVASNAGVEEGFARIFRTLNAGLSESNGLVELLANGFNEATKWADDLILFPQSFIRALEGRDSVVADWLGKDETDQLKKDWKEIKDLWKEINAIEYPAWMPTLESTAKEISGLLKQIAELSRWGDRLVDSTSSDAPDYSFWTNPITATYQMLGRNTAPFLGVPESTIEKYGLGNNPSSGDSTRYGLFDKQQLGPKESNAFGLDPSKLDFNLPTNEFDKSFTGRDARNYEPSLYKPKGSLDSADNLSDVLLNDGFDKSFAGKDYRTFEPSLYNPKASTDRNSNVFNDTLPTDEFDRSLASTLTDARQISTTNQFNIQLTVDAATLGGIDIEVQAQQLAQAFATNLEQVAVFFPNKE